MPIIRKILDVGPVSKAIVLPKSWLEFYENQAGEKIECVTIEVNRKLTIEPYIKKKRKTLPEAPSQTARGI